MGTGGNNHASEEGKSRSSKRSRVEEAEVSSSHKHKSSSHQKDRKKDLSQDQHRLKSHISKKKNDEDRSMYDRDNYKLKSYRSSKETDSHFDQRERHEVRYWDVGAERPYRGEDESKYLEHRRFRRKRSSSYCNEDEIQEPLVRYWNDDKKNKKDGFDSESKDREDYLVGTRYYAEPKKKRSDDRNLKKQDFVKNDKDVKTDKSAIGAKKPDQKKTLDLLTSKTGGAYIPPGKLRLMQSNITDKSSMAYQRIAWEALKKSIHGHINKVNTSNIGVLTRLLFKENIIRGRGLLCRSIIQAQAASQTFTNVYACLVAIINSKFPNIGELLLRRVVIQFKRGFKRNDKSIAISAATFIAHLVNQRVAHEVIALEILTLLLDKPTDDSVEVAVAFLKEVGLKLSEVSSRGFNAIFDMLRSILHEGKLDKRVQYMIEVIFQVRKDDFRAHPAVIEALDLIEEEDQFTHLLTLDEANDAQDILNVFKFDEQFEDNENRYKTLMKDILDDDDDDDDEDNSGSEGGSEDSDEATDSEKDEENKTTILDNTETNLIALRKTIYLTIQSSLDFEECAHKLLKMEIKPGQEAELCHMLLDCCAEQRTYEKFFGLLAQRFCQINRIYVGPFEAIFQDSYATVHRLDTNKLRNVAKFFAHLLFTDAISWEVLSTVKLNEEDTTSSSRIFIKILFQELSEYMGLANLNARVKDVTLQTAMEGLFPRDNPKNTRFAINFFTSIGLGGLTDELREHLKSQPKVSAVPHLVSQLSSGSSSSSSSSSSSDSSSDSSSSDSSSDSDQKKTKKKKKKPTEKNMKQKEKNMSIKSSKKNSKEVNRKSAK